MIWCGSTEVYMEPSEAHSSIEAFEKAMAANDPAIAPSMIYAYAALMEGASYANGAPNLSVDIPALEQLARDRGIPIAGKDFKSGQTRVKPILAPGMKARIAGRRGELDRE